jgi:uncharacterized repeat protein (TIGR03803 family)
MRTLEHTITTGGTLLAALLAFTALTGAQTSRPTLTTLYNFPGGGDGANPNAGVTGSDGVLYGTTFYGGSANNGTVFSLTPPTTSGVRGPRPCSTTSPGAPATAPIPTQVWS